MSIRLPRYNEEKATQVAAYLLKQNDGSMGLLRFTKIMYNIQREAMRKYSFPVTYDSLCSMGEGQVLSNTYDNSKPENKRRIWDKYIGRKDDILYLKLESPTSQLSKVEKRLIVEVFNRDKGKSLSQLIKEHHDYQEWIDPGESSIPTDYEDLLKALGKKKDEIDEIKNELRAEAYMEGLLD
jgi:hypothetical protein